MSKLFLTGGTGFSGKSIPDMLTAGYNNDTQFETPYRNPQKFLTDFPGYGRLANGRFIKNASADSSF